MAILMPDTITCHCNLLLRCCARRRRASLAVDRMWCCHNRERCQGSSKGFEGFKGTQGRGWLMQGRCRGKDSIGSRRCDRPPWSKVWRSRSTAKAIVSSKLQDHAACGVGVEHVSAQSRPAHCWQHYKALLRRLSSNSKALKNTKIDRVV